jgi:glutamate dehydrogenase
MVERLAPGLLVMESILQDSASEEEAALMEAQENVYTEGGFPAELARRTVMLYRLFPSLDVVETSAQRNMKVENVALVYFSLGDSLRLKWLSEQFENLPVKGQWHALARANLRDELFSIQNELVEQTLQEQGKHQDTVARWSANHQAQVTEVVNMLDDMARLPTVDYATATVAVRSLGMLLHSVKNP